VSCITDGRSLATAARLATSHCSSTRDGSRRTRVSRGTTHEAEFECVINGYRQEYLVLARSTQVLSEKVIDRHLHRIVNIHHSFLPAFAGASQYRQAFGRVVKVIGATAHFVTAELDGEPIIEQTVIHIDHTYTCERMAQAGCDVEKLVLARAVQFVLEKRVLLHGRRTVVFG